MAALLPAAAAAAIPSADAISPPAAPATPPAAAPSAAASAAPAASNVLGERSQRFEPVWSAKGIVAAEQRQAMAVGAAVLRQGGNAVDAAVATA
ncbi:MAG: gamma-glutamyltransferase, partial [Synechococcaceae cyanobacterium]